jgi:hypothetical protein
MSDVHSIYKLCWIFFSTKVTSSESGQTGDFKDLIAWKERTWAGSFSPSPFHPSEKVTRF